ncbi:MAG: retroviral-like aspartic protease family protein [Capsulimonadaceae bacterium]
MIQGVFRDNHPRVTLTVSGEAGQADIEFIVDTGFYGDLAISQDLLRSLSLLYMGPRVIRLASGEQMKTAIHIGTVNWIDCESREVEVMMLDGDALLGTNMLAGVLLQIEGDENGVVSLENLD